VWAKPGATEHSGVARLAALVIGTMGTLILTSARHGFEEGGFRAFPVPERAGYGMQHRGSGPSVLRR
jgi:hypothetical protein